MCNGSSVTSPNLHLPHHHPPTFHPPTHTHAFSLSHTLPAIFSNIHRTKSNSMRSTLTSWTSSKTIKRPDVKTCMEKHNARHDTWLGIHLCNALGEGHSPGCERWSQVYVSSVAGCVCPPPDGSTIRWNCASTSWQVRKVGKERRELSGARLKRGAFNGGIFSPARLDRVMINLQVCATKQGSVEVGSWMDGVVKG